ncbi:MAG: DUF4349 domain-containing protein, partial [bacterium]|nr:DUF4349 domain-containing protein [bacterium]
MTLKKTLKSVPILFLVLVMVLAACGGDDSDSSFDEISSGFDAAPETTAAMAEEQPRVEGGEDAAEAPAGQLGSGGVDGGVLQTSTLGRDIIFTADMTVAVTDVAAAGAEATRIIQEMGGYLFGQQTTGAPEPYSVLTFKVLPGDFQQALSRLGSVGEIRTQNVSADDVTEKVVDLESRIATARASVE